MRTPPPVVYGAAYKTQGSPVSGAVLTCTPAEARQRLGAGAPGDGATAPALARGLREAGAGAVVIVDEGPPAAPAPIAWIDTGHACGWLAPAPGNRADAGGRNDVLSAFRPVFERELAEALARGFVAADAAVLAFMAAASPGTVPLLSWDEQPLAASGQDAPPPVRQLDLYAIVDSAARLRQVLDAGVRTVQLRIKLPPHPDAGSLASLRAEIGQSVEAAAAAGAELFVNDHWRVAAELGAGGVHLGQEDLLALGGPGRAGLRRTGMSLGVSSHSLWELCRAQTLAPRYIACGPVWPTLTKAMPWLPQGLDNLAWWCRMARSPVVAIGGVLGPDEVRAAAAAGADGVCIVRGLGERPASVLPALQRALEDGRAARSASAGGAPWPHPSLPPEAVAPAR